MPFAKGQSGNAVGRPKGSLSSKVALKNLLNDIFQENEDKARKLLKGMFDDPKDFRWLCELKASLEPKELEHSGEIKFSAEELQSARQRLNAIN